MEKLDIRQDAKLHFTAATEMRVKNEMDTDAKTFIGPASFAPSLMASDVIIFCAGADNGGDDLAATVVQIGQRLASPHQVGLWNSSGTLPASVTVQSGSGSVLIGALPK